MAAHPTAGHTNALRAIGERLLTQGHSVAMSMAAPALPWPQLWPEPLRVAASLPQAIAAQGIELLPLRPSPGLLWHASRISNKTGYAELAVAIELFTSGLAGHARQLAAHARRWRADVVVGDYLMPAAMLAARIAGLPFVAVYHSALPFPLLDGPPFGSGLRQTDHASARWREAEEALERIARRFEERVLAAAAPLGLEGVDGLLTRPLSRDLNLLLTTAELEPGLAPLEGPIRMIGPCVGRQPGDESHEAVLAMREADAPRVYVSLGTVFNAKPRVLEEILEGLPRARVVMSAGASYERLAPRSDGRVRVFRSVPQVALLDAVDVVVTHGGNNTVQECLAAGRPMVVIPFGGDQIDNAHRVERLGVGRCVRVEELSAASLARAIEEVSSAEHAARARELRAALSGRDGASEGAEAILALC